MYMYAAGRGWQHIAVGSQTRGSTATCNRLTVGPRSASTPHPSSSTHYYRPLYIRAYLERQHLFSMSEATRPTRSLKGRVAIVTGAGALDDGIGNGRASAILLAEAGCDVVCVDLKVELAERTVQMIEQEGLGKAIAMKANVTNEANCKKAVEATVEQFGRLDILVNVVGVGGALGTAKDVDMTEWATGMTINVASMVMMSKVKRSWLPLTVQN